MDFDGISTQNPNSHHLSTIFEDTWPINLSKQHTDTTWSIMFFIHTMDVDNL
jgi:hypothetical protein